MAADAGLSFKSAVSRHTLELLLDLVEIKLSCVEVFDREDAREVKALGRARAELAGLLGRSIEAPPASSRRGRRSSTIHLVA